MDKFIAFFKKVFSKIETKMIFGIILFSSAFLLFFNPMETDKYNESLIVCFVVSAMYFVCYVLKTLFHYIKSMFFWICKYMYIKKSASNEERKFLYDNYYNKEENTFNTQAILPINDGITKQFELNKMIYRASNIFAYRGYAEALFFPYNIQPGFYKIINLALKKGKIKIENNTIKFK